MEDVAGHLMPHLSLHPTMRTCSSDNILRGILDLSTANTPIPQTRKRALAYIDKAEQLAGEGSQEHMPACGWRDIGPCRFTFSVRVVAAAPVAVRWF